ncbi:MAG: hypothetical protein LBT60_03290 [Oscillospiraceae bacterium]|jgi:Na+-transporting methylmalonyl-CoA/oxaloacetate decarboxylase gamma subunit|nr:hypothetical protein [Oscillospiraceae bacterium]
MIIEGLRVTLFGMAGIFVAIGVIIGAVWLLNRFAASKDDEETGIKKP